jgi:capsular exopolysaccharide synthesis family protein
MSRIDEALRRSLNEGASEQPAAGPFQEAAAVRLEDYPAEFKAQGASAIRPVQQSTPVSIDDSGALATLGRLGSGQILGLPKILPAALEAYRRLGAALHEAQVERGLKTIVLTSAVPREGKTVTASNLAVTLSESYRRRVLLIDADLRRPSVHQMFGIPNVWGLTETLRDETQPVKLVSVSRRLSVLPSGRPDQNPVGGLSSTRMAALLQKAAEQFDWVLLDSPPVGLLPDAQHLTRMADAVVFVIGAGMTPYRLIQRAVAEVGADRIFGAVLNRVSADSISMSPYYQHYYAGEEGQSAD